MEVTGVFAVNLLEPLGAGSRGEDLPGDARIGSRHRVHRGTQAAMHS